MQKVYALGALLRSNEMAGQKTGVDWSIDGVNSPVRSIEHKRGDAKNRSRCSASGWGINS
jgi:hypothetical protein